MWRGLKLRRVKHSHVASEGPFSITSYHSPWLFQVLITSLISFSEGCTVLVKDEGEPQSLPDAERTDHEGVS
jgi:hypothetical protein